MALIAIYFCKIIKENNKKKLKPFLQRIQEIMKKKILGSSDTWLTSLLS